jgi:uncharacterized protein YutE (UPF0331/DUF86 family)
MQLDVYLRETASHAARLDLVLSEARRRLVEAGKLSPLEFGGVLHTIQVLVENAIGKAKQLVKASQGVTPVDAYSAFEALADSAEMTASDLAAWRMAVGMRNRIVHDYLNIDESVVYELLETDAYRFVVDFLKRC